MRLRPREYPEPTESTIKGQIYHNEANDLFVYNGKEWIKIEKKAMI